MDRMLKKNIIAFIVVRLSSSRLYKKQLKKIGNKRLIDWTIENLKKSKFLNKIVIATTDDPVNYELKNVARDHNVDIFFYKGETNDVVGRLTKAAQEYHADIPVLISGDCPLIPVEVLDEMIETILRDDEVDCVGICQKCGKKATIEGIGVFRLRTWLKADELSNTPPLREHQFPIIGLKSDLFNIKCIEVDDIYYKLNHRISVDTKADLKFMNTVYDKLKKENREFSLKNVINLLAKNNSLIEINKDVYQMKLEEEAKKSLFIVKNEKMLNLFFDMAYDLTKKGIGVRFYTNCHSLKNQILNEGFGTIDCLNEIDFDILIQDNTINKG